MTTDVNRDNGIGTKSETLHTAPSWGSPAPEVAPHTKAQHAHASTLQAEREHTACLDSLKNENKEMKVVLEIAEKTIKGLIAENEDLHKQVKSGMAYFRRMETIAGELAGSSAHWRETAQALASNPTAVQAIINKAQDHLNAAHN